MRILHTADWHLGKKLDGFSRMEEQIAVLDEIITIADTYSVDMVLVAGDLFDHFNPGVEAVELFYSSLKRLSDNGRRPVIAISGNHDAPGLIDAPDPLARACGIILIGHPNAVVQPLNLPHFKISRSSEGMIEIILTSFAYPIRILHTPYANEIRLKQYLGENKEDALNEVLAQNWKKQADTYCDESGVNILTAHLYMNQRGKDLIEEPDGEKPIKIGNADMIYSEAVPVQIQYTALGHIHSFKNIGTSEKPIIYSSSPLCYSFSEAGQTKYIAIVDLEPGEQAKIEKVPLTRGKPLSRKTFNSIQEAVFWLQEHQHVLVELTIESETFLKADERRQLYQAHNGIIHLIPKVKNREATDYANKEINLNQNISDLFKDYFKSKNGDQQPNDEIMDLFNEILND